MLAPFLIIFCVLTILPILSSLVLSFTEYDTISAPSFIGIENYMRMFTSDDVFPITLRNTLIFAVITGPLGFLLSFVLAWFVNEFSPKVRTVLSFLFYAPALMGNAFYIWKILFSGDSYGYLNSLLLSMGVITEPILWLREPAYILGIVVLVQL